MILFVGRFSEEGSPEASKHPCAFVLAPQDKNDLVRAPLRHWYRILQRVLFQILGQFIRCRWRDVTESSWRGSWIINAVLKGRRALQLVEALHR